MGTLRDPPHKYRAEHYWLPACDGFEVICQTSVCRRLWLFAIGRPWFGARSEWDVWRVWSPMGTLLLGGERCEYDRQDAYPTT
jgi:hypothetical protein